MTGWRYASAFMAVVALLLDAHTGVWAQASNANRHLRTAFPTRPGDNATRWGATSEAAPGSTSSDPTSR